MYNYNGTRKHQLDRAPVQSSMNEMLTLDGLGEYVASPSRTRASRPQFTAQSVRLFGSDQALCDGIDQLLGESRESAIGHGDSAKLLDSLPSGIVQTCVTSPPYWSLRDYEIDGQIGLEDSVEEYIKRLVEVFEGVRRVLRDDGTLWLNIGDSYTSGGRTWRAPDKRTLFVR